jgi:hypothetical protein
MSSPTTIVGQFIERATSPVAAARLAMTGGRISLGLALGLTALAVGALLLLGARASTPQLAGVRIRETARAATIAGVRRPAVDSWVRLQARRRRRSRARRVWRL